MNKLKASIVCFLLLCFLGNAQDREIKNARKNFKQGSYAEAIVQYKQLLSKGYAPEETYKYLGDSYYYIADYSKAAEWYSKLFEIKNILHNDEYLFRYAMALKSIGKYPEADKQMQQFSRQNPLDSRAIKFIAAPDYLQQIEAYSDRVTISNMPINSKTSDFAPSIRNNRLIFSSTRDSGLIKSILNSRGDNPFYKLYQTSEAKPLKFSKQIDTKAAETTTAFSKDGNTIYFTRNNFKKGSFYRDKDGVSRTKIYRARFIDNIWTEIEELPFNGSGYSVAHPALSPDEKKLYFSSDMPGTIGMSDIFCVAINSDSTFGEPINLGSEINTSGRDTFPFVSDSNVLYFASDGHIGLGGLDIFATQLHIEKACCIVNVGSPINSKADDFAFILDEQKQLGYFSSNREGGMGSDDIYSFTVSVPLHIKCTEQIQGLVQNGKNNSPIENATISLLNNEGIVLGKSATDAKGNFEFNVKFKSGSYKIISEKKGFEEKEVQITMALDKNNTNRLLTMNDIRPSKGADLMVYLNSEPILFNKNKSDLTAKSKESLVSIAAYLLEFPEIQVTVNGHTDASGTEEYNQKLSEKRAIVTMDYLITLGVDADRLSFKGYGETQLLYDCEKGQTCTKEDKHKNRRTECIVSDEID